ncbi:MAG: choice-of-anchor V domain-containing protein, partial [Bacteroidia bacterium]
METKMYKTKKLILSSALGITLSAMLISGTTDEGTCTNHIFKNANGTSSSTGAPGEPHTCSQAGCHGAGDGSSSTGGLADNAGPGGIVISSVPAFIGGTQYTPGTTYHMTITINETGKLIFGMDAEILDNSGATDTHINNAIGTYTLTDPAHTRFAQAFGTGRKCVTHVTDGGLSTNTASFIFDWTAPATGVVNIYTSAVAANHDNLPNANDNV